MELMGSRKWDLAIRRMFDDVKGFSKLKPCEGLKDYESSAVHSLASVLATCS